jgi:hypothetical protein
MEKVDGKQEKHSCAAGKFFLEKFHVSLYPHTQATKRNAHFGLLRGKT